MLTAEVMDQYIRENAEAPTKPAAGPVDETGGSYDYEKLQAVLELWAQRNEGFEWIATNTSKGPGFRISCPGATGWPDGAVHSESSAPLNGSAVCWVENGHPRFTCKHAHCGDGAPQGKKTWKHLAECLGRSAQREVLTGSPLLSSQTLLDLSVRPVLLILEKLRGIMPARPPKDRRIRRGDLDRRWPVEQWRPLMLARRNGPRDRRQNKPLFHHPV